MDIGHGEQSLTARLIWLIASPVVFLVGVVGNGLTLAVFLNRKNKKSSTSIYFIWLAFADMIVLFVELPRWWLLYSVQYDFRHYSDMVCKLQMLGIIYPSTLSSWVLMALTIERLISVIRPHQMKIMCTPRSANIICVCILAFTVLLSGTVIYGHGLIRLPAPQQYQTLNGMNNMTQCEVAEIQTGCINSSIDGTSVAATSNLRAMSTSAPAISDLVLCTWYQDDSSKIAMNMDRTIQFVSAFLLIQIIVTVADVIIIYKLTFSGMNRGSSKQTGHIRQITLTLLSVNIVYMVCRTPLFVFMTFFNIPDLDTVAEQREIIWASINILFWCNHAVNFYLYVLIGTRFRKQVKDLLCGWRKMDAPSKGGSDNKA